MPLRFLLRSLFCAGILGAVACGQVNSAKTGVAGPNPIGAGGGSTTPTVPSGGGGGTVVDSAGFFLAATGSSNTNMVQYMHQADAAFGSDIGTTNFSTECKIAEGSATGGDILCVAEVEELDLWFNNFNIQYHVPSDMCTYVAVTPYWFYAYAPGRGPAIVSHEVNFDGSIVDVTNTSGGIATCTYDYSNAGGPNCCVGAYTHTITAYASDGTFTQSHTPATWGGSVGNCVAGAAASIGEDTTGFSSFGRNSVGTPASVIFYTHDTGLNNLLQVKAPSKAVFNSRSPLSSSLWTSNFYVPSSYAAPTFDPVPMRIPAAIPGAGSGYDPSNTYAFSCLDAALDIKQRIRLFVREWNTHAIAENGNPDVAGNEPVYGTPYNDLADWADFGASYPASSL